MQLVHDVLAVGYGTVSLVAWLVRQWTHSRVSWRPLEFRNVFLRDGGLPNSVCRLRSSGKVGFSGR